VRVSVDALLRHALFTVYGVHVVHNHGGNIPAMVALRRIILFVVLGIVSFSASQAPKKEAPGQEAIDRAYSQSYTLEKAQNYSGAMEALYPVLRAWPNGYTVNYRMGWLSYLNGNFADALAYYAKALSLYPASIEAISSVALVHKARLAWNRVAEEQYKIIKIDYFNFAANYEYACALKMEKKYGLAEKTCRKMLTIYPTSVPFLFALAENLYFLGKKKEALETFLSVRTLDPYHAGAAQYIGKLIDK
jgi:tetratricopeptide (TPR) repeat protein